MDKLISFLLILKDVLVSVGRWIEAHSAFVTSAATLAIAGFTWALWWATQKLWETSLEQSKDMKTSITIAKEAADAAKHSAIVAKNTLLSTKRAFVFLKDIQFRQVRDLGDYSIFRWQFSPEWENSGETATKNLTISVAARIIHARLKSDHIPNNFDYSFDIMNIPNNIEVSDTHIMPLKDIPLMIGPKATIISQSLLFTTDIKLIRFIIDGPVYFFMWGEAKYNDIFDGTPQHRTRFCIKLHFINQSGEQTPRMSFSYYGKYNCADEDCNEQS